MNGTAGAIRSTIVILISGASISNVDDNLFEQVYSAGTG